jgi:large subunit ribosomal protein L27
MGINNSITSGFWIKVSYMTHYDRPTTKHPTHSKIERLQPAFVMSLLQQVVRAPLTISVDTSALFRGGSRVNRLVLTLTARAPCRQSISSTSWRISKPALLPLFSLLHQPATNVRWATKKAGGSSNNGRDSAGRRLGIKAFPNLHYPVPAGSILVRQRGKKFLPGANVGIGRDHSIFAKAAGYVQFTRSPTNKKRNIVHILTDKPTNASGVSATNSRQ